MSEMRGSSQAGRDTPCIVFVGAILPDGECASNPACSVAGNKFQKNLVFSLGTAARKAVDVISYVPAAMFPRGGRMVYRGGARRLDGGGQEVRYISYVNLPVVKQMTQALAILVALIRWHRQHRGTARVAMVYNLFAPHALPVLAARALCGGRAVVVVADTPHDVYSMSGFWGIFQRLDMFAQTRGIRRFDGQIALTRGIVADFAPNVPAMVLEGGVCEQEAGSAVPAPPDDKRVVLFSGRLDEINGIELMLAAFSHLVGPRYRLRIFGRGPSEAAVRRAASADCRIEYLGHRPNAEVVREQRGATVLIIPRPTTRAITRYTFPSKLLEYMASGRPVITTALPGIPPEYFSKLFVVADESACGLAACIRSVCERSTLDLDAVGEAARAFVLSQKGWHRQGERAYEFVVSLLCARRELE